MRSILEQAINHLLNDDNDKAQEYFHRYMVERARQIHESIREGEDDVIVDDISDDFTSEEYFTEADLDDDVSDVEVPTADLTVDGVDSDAGELASDLGDSGEVDGFDGESSYTDGDPDATVGDDMGRIEDNQENVDDEIDELKDQMAKLEAEFNALMDEMASEDGSDEFSDEVDADVDGDVEVDVANDVGGEEEVEVKEDVDADADFDDITESVVDDLLKVSIENRDGAYIGDGGSFEQNRKSPVASGNGKAGAVKINADEHKGFERETAPAVGSLGTGNNVRKKSTEGNKPQKAGQESSALNTRLPGENDKSPVPTQKK